MASDPKSLDVTIMGRALRVACPPEDRAGLLDAVDYLDRRMQEIKDGGKVANLERIAIMAALNITHELLTTRVGGFDVGDFKRRINDMNKEIDQVMSDSGDLFK
ncbi:MAG: cell division protein ZapA [Betaproteobacteria bacterium RBG_16_58_11]|nr:MAG: cell division protein ZapA [Betaproteobacteria bacterium RBG_16_58_11]OFZ99456.1 MAG: cell division protein ZapA [Betaproteobacteria bacterium RBG_19FT_COMBO_58_11]